MKIESIEKYKGKTMCIVLESGERLYMNEEILAEYGFCSDGDYDISQLRDALDADLRRKAKERALYLISDHDHSVKELFDKLKKNYGEEIAGDTCEKMLDYGFLDDERYASRLAKAMFEYKHFGFRKIRFELARKGFDPEVIEDAMYELDEDETVESIKALIDRKYSRYLTDPTDRKSIQKVTNALARLGHGFDDIKRAIKEYIEDEEV